MSEEKLIMDFEKAGEQHLKTWHQMIMFSKLTGVLLALVFLVLLIIYFN